MTPRPQPIALVSALCLSLGLNAFLFFREVEGLMGGSQSMNSPDGKYWVEVGSRVNVNPLTSDRRVYGVIELRDALPTDEPLRTFTIMPITPQNSTIYRVARDFIEWSDDSKNVTVTTPDFTLSINVEPVTPDKGNWKELMELAREMEEFSAKEESR